MRETELGDRIKGQEKETELGDRIESRETELGDRIQTEEKDTELGDRIKGDRMGRQNSSGREGHRIGIRNGRRQN